MASVTDQAPRARVAERLTRLRAADERLSSALDAVVAAVAQIPKRAIDREPVSALETTVGALREPLPPDVARVSSEAPGTSGIVDQPPSETAAASEAIQAAFGAVSNAGAAATALFTTARLMYHGAVCTFADGRSQGYAATSKALHDLLPQVVAWELREAGMYCQCICPMCGLGTCGCIWASLHTIAVAWNRPGLPGPDERGSCSDLRRGPGASSRTPACRNGPTSPQSTVTPYVRLRSFRRRCASTRSAQRRACGSRRTATHARVSFGTLATSADRPPHRGGADPRGPCGAPSVELDSVASGAPEDRGR